jgi:hypothetical protein
MDKDAAITEIASARLIIILTTLRVVIDTGSVTDESWSSYRA